MNKFWLRLKFSFFSLIQFALINKLTILIAAISLVVDIASKFLARTFLNYAQSVNILGDFLRFTLVFNRGISFGIFNSDQSTLIHTILPFLTIIIILFLFYSFISLLKEVDIRVIPMLKIGFGFIWGGGLGNLIDRILNGYVTDFIDIGISNIWRFYTFNIADSCITIGTTLIIISIVYSDLKTRKYEESD
ncbi:MAG: signal peptidase II [Brevinematia bacterium]